GSQDCGHHTMNGFLECHLFKLATRLPPVRQHTDSAAQPENESWHLCLPPELVTTSAGWPLRAARLRPCHGGWRLARRLSLLGTDRRACVRLSAASLRGLASVRLGRRARRARGRR